MTSLFSWLFNRTFLILLGLVIVSCLIYFAGPLIGFTIGNAKWVPLESVVVRAVIIGLIFAIWIGIRLFRWWQERRRNAALIKELAKDENPPAPGETALGAEEVAELRRRFDTALSTLKSSRTAGGKTGFFARFSRQYVYQMPWYMFIGAPGSGKTTALVNSGLEFPLADKFGKSAIRGVGGTRNCDWWFTNEAVLLDTAGRYTTQESNQAVDKVEWEGFLKLLRKFRPRAPINGVILTASVADLLGSSEEERGRQAAAIRRRLSELYDTLDVRFPVYLIVTKTDLLGGFNEYFDRLTTEERAQVWGFTFPLSADGAGLQELAQTFRTEHALLQKRIEDALPDLLQAEPDVQRRALIYSFTQQFAGLRDVLGSFLVTLFSDSKFAVPPMLRGVYFTSGTQEGTPFDRVLGSIQRRFGVEARVQSATAAAGTGKSYFLRGLLQNLVFPESHLVSRNPARDRRMRIIQVVGITTCAIALVGASIAWFVSYSNNRTYLAEIVPKVQELGKEVQAAPTSSDASPAALLPILNDARNLASSDRFDIGKPPATYRFGLYQGFKVASAADAAYDRLIEKLLLPRVALRMETLLRNAPPDDLEALYGRLKAYLMLFDPDHYQSAFLLDAVNADWQSSVGATMTKEQQQDLVSHLRRLLEGRIRQSPVPRDDALVAQVRNQLGRYSPSKRIYGQLKGIIAERLGSNMDWTLVNTVGPDAKLVFARTSGKSLDEGIAALYTRDGYRALQSQLNNRKKLAELDETWVIGQSDRSAASVAADLMGERIVTEIRIAYLTEYRTAWDTFLVDLKLQRNASMADSIQLLRILSQPDSPMTKFIKSVADETALSDTGKDAAGVADKATAVVKKGANNAMSRIFGSAGSDMRISDTNEQNKAGQIEKQYVDSYFEQWRRLAASPAQGGTDFIKPLLTEVYTTMVANESALRSGIVPPPNDTSNKLRAESARLPVPLRGMLEGLAITSSAQAADVTRSNIGAQLNADLGTFCRTAIGGRYPFNRNADKDVNPDDFARLFAPGGQMDDFFQKNLAQIVDISTKPWSFRKGIDGSSAGTSGSLVAFERAAVIREAFFRAGGRTPQFRVEIKPVEMDASITQLTLDVDGQIVRYAYGPQVPTTITWPGPRQTNQVRLQLQPQLSGSSGTLYEGPWALHRLFDKAQIRPGSSPERFLAELNVDGRRAVFEINAGSVLNPLRLPELAQFTCPGKL
jgi:type VI secretion system protein ImpL